MLAWQLNNHWKYDPNRTTELDIRLVTDGDVTLVRLEHRDIAKFGERAAEVRAALHSIGGWYGALALHAARVENM